MAYSSVRRLDLGYFVRPASETGGPQPRVEPVLAYLVQHDNGLILFDTGSGTQTRKPKHSIDPAAVGYGTPSQHPESPTANPRVASSGRISWIARPIVEEPTS